jgi:hypothetical protein
MKRILLCTGVIGILIAYAVISDLYVRNCAQQTAYSLSRAVQSSIAGDSAEVRRYADSAWETWQKLCERGVFVLADLTVSSDVAISLVRVGVLAYGDDSARFVEEAVAAIMLLEHFVADNQSIMGGISQFG